MENKLSWRKLAEITTDGAPNMLGCNSGFIKSAKNLNPEILGFHWMIHRFALATKPLPEYFSYAFKIIVEIVNYIKTSALNTRLFKRMCDEFSDTTLNILYYSQVRWLSAGNMLNRVYEIKNELIEFFKNNQKCEYADFLRMNDTTISYLVDIFSHFNRVNLSLQGYSCNVFVHYGVISSFVTKLNLWINRVNENSYTQFEILNTHSSRDKNYLKRYIMEHLESLKSEFNKYFSELKLNKSDFDFVRNPFDRGIKVKEDLQEEIIDLQNDIYAHEIYKYYKNSNIEGLESNV